MAAVDVEHAVLLTFHNHRKSLEGERPQLNYLLNGCIEVLKQFAVVNWSLYRDEKRKG